MMLPPDETIIRLLLRVVEAFVPPFAIGSIPDTPLVKDIKGISAATNDLNVGAKAPPDTGPANTVLEVSVAKPTARVPLVVIGDPDTVRKLGTVNATDVTVPPVPVALIVILPAPLTIETPEPAVSVDGVGMLKVLPISNCPLARAGPSAIWPAIDSIILLLARAVVEFVPPRAIGTGTLKLRLVVPPRDTVPPPVKPVPGDTVREEFCSNAFVILPGVIAVLAGMLVNVLTLPFSDLFVSVWVASVVTN